MWHGVGVGKTCGAISIAENFKDKKIDILLPSNTLMQNWKDEIINIKKEFKKKYRDSMVQCTGNTYIDQIDIDYWTKQIDIAEEGEHTINNLRLNKRLNQIISEHYNFSTYMTLANSIEREFTFSRKECKSTVRQDILSCPLKDEYSLHKFRKLFYNEQIKYIKARFSNKVIIMDEIHQTRSNGGISETENKKIRPYLEMIARYAVNTHFILLSATPMYNITSEISWILNLLLWNDGRGPIYTHMFNKTGLLLKSSKKDITLMEKNKQLLIQKSRGYISFLRGENPFTFPIKLSPNIHNRSEDDYFFPKPDKYLHKKKIHAFGTITKPNSCFKHIEQIKFLYPDYFSDWQYSFISKGMKKKKIDLTMSSLLTKKSNIVYPIIQSDGTIDETYDGTMGDAFDQIHNYKYTYTHEDYPFMRISDTDETDASPQLLKKHSIKIYNIIKCIKHSLPIRKRNYTSGDILQHVDEPGGGIVFIYSKYKNFGLKPMAFALEELGLNRFVLNKPADYTDSNMLIRERDDSERFCAYNKCRLKDIDPTDTDKVEHFKHTFTQARYIYLDGYVPKKMLNHLVKEVRGDGISNRPNIYGEHILAILGTRVVEVGLSFFNVRQIHILEPWYHFNEMVQVVGRGSRNFSHKQLDKSFRNVMVYLHVGTYMDNNRLETIDERLYRRSYCKKKNMIEVELILKQNAVDCQLNIKGNIFVENENDEDMYYGNGELTMDIYDSIGSYNDNHIHLRQQKHVGDEDYSLGCNLKKCKEFKCYITDDSIDEIDTSTFQHVNNKKYIHQSKILIKKLFKRKHYYELKNILDILKSDSSFFSHSKDTDVDKNKIIFSALDILITNKEPIYNKKNIGYLIMRQYQDEDTRLSFYIFQPKIINKTNIQTYSSIHSKVFQKKYNKIHTQLQSSTQVRVIQKLDKQKDELFKKLFIVDDTSMPNKFRNTLLHKEQTYHLPKIDLKETLDDKGSIEKKSKSTPIETMSTTHVSEEPILVESILVDTVPTIPNIDAHRHSTYLLKDTFELIKWYTLHSIQDDSPNVPDSEHFLTMERYHALDMLLIKDKKNILKHYISNIITIDKVSTVERVERVERIEFEEYPNELQTFYERVSSIYALYKPKLNNAKHISTLIKKQQQKRDLLLVLATRMVESSITDGDSIVSGTNTKETYIRSQYKELIGLYELIYTMTLYLKYDHNVARLFLGKLRDVPHITHEYNNYSNLKPFIKQSFQQYIYSAKKGSMGNLYKHINTSIRDIMYTLIIVEFYDKYNTTVTPTSGAASVDVDGMHMNYTILRNKRDLYERRGDTTIDVSNEIVGFILRYPLKGIVQQRIFIFDDKKNTFDKNGLSIIHSSHDFNYLQFESILYNKNSILGFSLYNTKKHKIMFKLLDNSTQIKKTKGGKINKKFINRGVVCGSGNARTRVGLLKRDIENILDITLLKTKKNITHYLPLHTKLILGDLCKILSIILRYKEHEHLFIPSAVGGAVGTSIDSNIKWFYNFEESLFLKF